LSKVAEGDKRKYLNELKAVDSTFGEITDFTPAGFRFNYPENGNNFLHISGSLKRTKQDTQFSNVSGSFSSSQFFDNLNMRLRHGL